MKFHTDFVSRAGGRELNEDYCGFLEVDESVCWVVADGLGGYQGGEMAARIAVETILTSFRDNTELSASALQRHLNAAQQAILKAQREQPKLSTMRTTVVVLVSDSRRALWAHAGDSRLYCFENGQIVFCTSDHSVVQAMVSAGELSPDQIRNNEDRNKLLRCLGNPDAELRSTILPEPRPLGARTSFLLCTDGFWEKINESEMEVDLAKAQNVKEWLTLMSDRVLDRITDDSDNYTAIALTSQQSSADRLTSGTRSTAAAGSRPAAPRSRLRMLARQRYSPDAAVGGLYAEYRALQEVTAETTRFANMGAALQQRLQGGGESSGAASSMMQSARVEQSVCFESSPAKLTVNRQRRMARG
jgi:serine/threonine protein phosphatase PrpC